MAVHFVFADEAGCFKFEAGDHASRYFILCTLRMETCDVGAELLDLRRRMMARKQIDGEGFHCTTDKQAVRDEVFGVLGHHQFAIDSTILEKRKALPRTRKDEPTFYKYAWYYNAKDLLPKRFKADDNVLISAAALDTIRVPSASERQPAGRYRFRPPLPFCQRRPWTKGFRMPWQSECGGKETTRPRKCIRVCGASDGRLYPSLKST